MKKVNKPDKKIRIADLNFNGIDYILLSDSSLTEEQGSFLIKEVMTHISLDLSRGLTTNAERVGNMVFSKEEWGKLSKSVNYEVVLDKKKINKSSINNAKKDNDRLITNIPEEFRWMEVKGTNFVVSDSFGMKVTPNGIVQKTVLGGQVIFDKKNKTTFERAVRKSGREKCHEIQLIKSKCFHSEFHKEAHIMFCEYLADIKVISDQTYIIGKHPGDIKAIPSKKSFEEECEIEPTEEEWNKALKYRNRRILKTIKFSDDFETYESIQIDIPLKISEKDRKEIYLISGSEEYWQEKKLNGNNGEIYNKLKKICDKYYSKDKEEKELEKLSKEYDNNHKNEEESKVDAELKIGKWNKFKQSLSNLNPLKDSYEILDKNNGKK